jgi:hypothetical protein
MSAEICQEFHYRFRPVLADGTAAYRPLAVCIAAGNEDAISPRPYGPPHEIRGFCWCSINPASTGCVEQSLVLAAKNASRGRQPHYHRARDGGGNGGDSGDDGGGSDPPPLLARAIGCRLEGAWP